MWELDCEGSWVPKNWCFWTAVLEKTLESPLDCQEIQPVHSKGDQSWTFSGSSDAEAETPVLWPPHAKSWLIGKDFDAGRDWGQEEKGMTEDEMAGWHHQLSWVSVNSRSWWWTGRPGVLRFMGSQRVGHEWATELNWTELNHQGSPPLAQTLCSSQALNSLQSALLSLLIQKLISSRNTLTDNTQNSVWPNIWASQPMSSWCIKLILTDAYCGMGIPLKWWGGLLHSYCSKSWLRHMIVSLHPLHTSGRAALPLYYRGGSRALGRLSNLPKNSRWETFVSNQGLPLETMLQTTTLWHLLELSGQESQGLTQQQHFPWAFIKVWIIVGLPLWLSW